MINANKYFVSFFTFVAINFILCQSDVETSRVTAITMAIEKVGPSVACINVQQNVSAFSTPRSFFSLFFSS